jgi:uncharacterized Zn-binding protein involved in type VI secretion
MHTCPLATPATPPVPHVGGPITGTGCQSVLIGGLPAATIGEVCICTGGPPDSIISGVATVQIGGKAAVRMGDGSEHGGKVTSGCLTVLIGGEAVSMLHGRLVKVYEEEEEFEWPPEEERTKVIIEAIANCITLLETKLKLLKANDANTLRDFKELFGNDDTETKRIIKNRIRRTLKFCKRLTINNFNKIYNEDDRKIAFAWVDPTDKTYTISLGDKFWAAGATGKRSKEGIIIHELSHFKKIGKTKDYGYGKACFELGKIHPDQALYNAETFEYFITGVIK